MTGMREDLERRRHHRVERPRSHWNGDLLHEGPVEVCGACKVEPVPDPPEACPDCDGTGQTPTGISSGPVNPGQVEFEGCATCGGSGSR